MSEGIILWPREQARYATDEAVSLFLDSRQVEIINNLGYFSIPENPGWSEDPYTSRAWALYYNSLGWIYAAEEAFKRGQFNDFPQYAKNIILDFMADNDDPTQPTHEMVWHDGGNAFRLATISYLYENYFKPGNPNGISLTFTAEEQALFGQGLQNHLEALQHQLSLEEHWQDSNHRFFHSMSLASYATVFGQDPAAPFYEPNAAALLQQGLDVIAATLESIVDFTSGVTQEQSFMYHRLDMGLLLEAKQYVLDKGFDLGQDYDAVLARMLEFDLLSRRPGPSNPDTYYSEIGDSYYEGRNGTPYVNEIIAQGHVTPTSKYILSKGAEGVRPGDVVDYSQAGYIIMRPEYVWENARDTRILFDVSSARVSHGHFDNMNVLFSSYGQKILIDSGGPYSYDRDAELPGLDGPFKKEYFQTSPAHNVVVVDGKSYDVDTQLMVITDNDVFSFSAAKHQGYSGITITRNLVFLKDAGVMLTIDTADNDNAISHRYDLNWHINPLALGIDAAASGEFQIGDVYVDTAFATGSASDYSIVSGRLGQEPQGWITRGLYDASPAPVLAVTQNTEDAWFVSAFGTSLKADPNLLMSANKFVDGFVISLEYNGISYSIALGNNSQIDIVQNGTPPDPNNLTGDSGPNRLLGTSVANRISGEAGNDSIYGEGGDDSLYGGADNDNISGGEGKDLIEGGEGNDVISGGVGIDKLYGEAGDDSIYGGDNSDSIFGGAGADNLIGEAGNDTVDGGFENDTLRGGNGHDSLRGGDADDALYGELNNDTLDGGAGNDKSNGGAGDDTFLFELGDDLCVGGDGNDIFYVAPGTDRYYGDGGTDIAIIAGMRADFLVQLRGGYVVMLDRNISDGDYGREYFYGMEILRFSDTDLSL